MPEYWGGPWDYQEFLKTLPDPSDPADEGMIEWIGEAFDPEELDLQDVDEVPDGYCR